VPSTVKGSPRTLHAPAATAPVVAIAALVLAFLGASLPVSRVRVACVGDSITEGRDIPDPALRYPARLGAILGSRYEVRNLGAGGATLLSTGDRPYRRTEAFQRALAFRPDVVVIGLGSNDAKAWNWEGKASFGADARALVAAFRSVHPRVRVIFLLPPPVVGEGRFGIREEVVAGEVGPELARAARDLGAETVDLHRLLDGRPGLLPDSVHPDAAGAELIARAVAETILARSRPALTGRAAAPR
jgi:lysophospholipase L1-like esterase